MIEVYRDGKFIRNLESFELELAKRDVCYFYEEQIQWATISGQLSFGQVFNLPYWDYLDLKGGINQEDKKLIKRGSLLLLLSECLEFFDDLGTYYLIDKKIFSSLKNAIKSFNPIDKTEESIKK